LMVVMLVAPTAFAKVKLVKAVIEPAAAAAGEQVTVTVEFSGKAKNVKQVMLIPREYAYDIDQPYYLQQDASGKNIWMLQGPIPYEAPAGSVHLEVKAVDKDGKEIVLKKFKDQEFGKAGLIDFEIK